ncbi:MAG TPA: T9SS type A sorting domain-containing protein, partial [Flavobacteriales bacterium]|nr:T9SS type A sorting domain-containing protein [Flavobacteriales bacterium]
NPSRDIFNVSFVSDEVQNLKIRIVNLLGEVVFVDEKEKYIGQYSKAFNLNTYPKGIYMLEIETNSGVVNKKLILQ